jgi:beta-lactamase class A
VQAASKQGAVDKPRSDVVLVNAPSGDYVLLRRVSALLRRHFEPRHPWMPAAGAAAFKP